MLSLVIDIGNSFTKISIFEDWAIIFFDRQHHLTANYLANLRSRYVQIENAILSSVAKYQNEMGNYLSEWLGGKYKELNVSTLLPFANHYETKETLGKDRIAAVAGALHFFPSQNCLVVDMGTALTFDFIDNQANYWGGNISAGINLRFRALHKFTKRLPLVEANDDVSLLGTSTETAIRNGVINSIVFELERYVEIFEKKYLSLQVILTGGDSFFFAKRLKSNIFVEPNLVLIGLNKILKFNE